MPDRPTTDNPGDSPRWHIALDTGGTFTDLVARSPDGRMQRAKVPSDGSLSGTVLASDGRKLRIAAAARLAYPDGLLDGWSVVVSGIDLRVSVDRQIGEQLLLSRPVAAGRGDSVRFVPPTRGDGSATIDAPRVGMHILTNTPPSRALPPISLRLSTTRGTNALLEGRGARVGVLVSEGLDGVVEIGDQTRDDLFARVPRPRRNLASVVACLPERTLADGSVRARADDESIRAAAAELRAKGADTIVVSLAHALVDPARERSVASAAGGIAASSVAPHPRLLTRTETAVVHARIAPTLARFVEDATRATQGAAPSAHDETAAGAVSAGEAFIFTSAGILQRAQRFLARDTLLSGPAGGARALARVAGRHGFARAVGFDMGGTSSDVARVEDGRVALRGETRIGRATVAAPGLAIDSVAAGGGSVCRFRDGALEVGPESAGAAPGPACFGRGGPLTISDVNLLAGRLVSDFESIALDREKAEAALDETLEAMRVARRGSARDEPQDTAATRAIDGTVDTLGAFLDIANARMALAIENLCVRDGVDPAGHALVAFGGAGGQHACAIAERLGLDRIVFPRHAGFLCAQGVLDARLARIESEPVLKPLAGGLQHLNAACAKATAAALEALAHDGVEASDAVVERTASLRLSGQEATIDCEIRHDRATLDAGDAAELTARFHARFEALFGYAPPPRGIEVDSVRAEARDARPANNADAPHHGLDALHAPPVAYDRVPILSGGTVVEAALFRRGDLVAGQRVEGPALVLDVGDTVVLDAGWTAKVDASGDLLASRRAPFAPRTSAAVAELFAARLESIALGMGHVLERTALSPNIRDRLDFSCAILDHAGNLIQNAPHLPVHLGALGACVRGVARALDLAPGDIAVTNHPAYGGSHLPDVTCVAPVHVDGTLRAFVAVRAHHAEIGGTRPGSFPPDAANLAEEGVVLAPFHAVRGGAFDAAGSRARFAGGAFPSRNPDENLADLSAQIAAARHGVRAVAELARELGDERFARLAGGELVRAERALRRRIARLEPDAPHAASRELDDGSRIAVRLVREDRDGEPRLLVDFTGSAGVHPRNFNAPRAVTQAALLYALRLFVDEPVPMNEGLLRAVEVVLPTGMLNPPFAEDPERCPPVVAGNVETSQSVVAVLVEALGLAAESQSTMNNVLFGNDSFGVYETLGGGAGAGLVAGRPADGASAVHVHMSNTRLTDIDVLERRAPVVIRRFSVRLGTGGPGAGRGGDGLVRSYEFLAPVALSMFASRRRTAPKGLEGGLDGAVGRQSVQCDKHSEMLDQPGGVFALDLPAGGILSVETPGGGGWGSAGPPHA